MSRFLPTSAFACLIALSIPSGQAEDAERGRPNVLFIAVDDLNDWVGCLEGHPQVKTPHIDRLARRGVLFTKPRQRFSIQRRQGGTREACSPNGRSLCSASAASDVYAGVQLESALIESRDECGKYHECAIVAAVVVPTE